MSNNPTLNMKIWRWRKKSWLSSWSSFFSPALDPTGMKMLQRSHSWVRPGQFAPMALTLKRVSWLQIRQTEVRLEPRAEKNSAVCTLGEWTEPVL